QQMATLDDQLLAKDKQINAIADRVLHSKGKAKETALRQLEIQKQNRREMEVEWATLKKQQTTLEQVSQSLRTLKARAKGFMETISKPLRKPLIDIEEMLGAALKTASKPVKTFMKELASAVQPLAS